METLDRVRRIVAENSGLDESTDVSAPDTNLWDAGMDSARSVRIMIAVEDEFDVEMPDELLTRETFSSIRALAEAVLSITGEQEAG